MYTLFSAQYLSGPARPPRSAEVQLRPEGLIITLEGAEEVVRWPAASLRMARILPDGAVLLETDEKQFVTVNHPDFQKALQTFYPKKRLFHQSFFDRTGTAGCLLMVALVVFPLLLVYFWLGPLLSTVVLKNIPKEKETEIGKSLFYNVVEADKIDTFRTRLAREFLDSLHFPASYPLEVTVVHEPVMNAFALPGGPIVVFDSLLNTLTDPAEFAALLAHEASHIEYRHSTRKLLRDLGAMVLIGIWFGDAGDIGGVLAQQGGNLASLSYSRDLEREADDRGLQLLVGSGVPAEGMVNLLHRLKAADTQGSPEFLATHPATSERIERIQAAIGRIADKSAETPPALSVIWEKMAAGPQPDLKSQ